MQNKSDSSPKAKLEEPITSHKRVVLCYCREDLDYAQRLLVHLASCQRTSGLIVWDYSQIQPGSAWKTEVITALARAHVAILLISADFLASPFIVTFELPYLLNTARLEGTQILPVILRPCLFEESPLAVFQAFNDPARPLSLLSRNAREQAWVSIVRTLLHTPLRSFTETS